MTNGSETSGGGESPNLLVNIPYGQADIWAWDISAPTVVFNVNTLNKKLEAN
jgi:hypothetical protein